MLRPLKFLSIFFSKIWPKRTNVGNVKDGTQKGGKSMKNTESVKNMIPIDDRRRRKMASNRAR